LREPESGAEVRSVETDFLMKSEQFWPCFIRNSGDSEPQRSASRGRCCASSFTPPSHLFR